MWKHFWHLNVAFLNLEDLECSKYYVVPAKERVLCGVAEAALDSVCEFNNCNPEVGAKKNRLVTDSAPKDMQVDAGVFREGVTSFGCVLKKHNMDICLAASKRENIYVEPTVAEIVTPQI